MIGPASPDPKSTELSVLTTTGFFISRVGSDSIVVVCSGGRTEELIRLRNWSRPSAVLSLDELDTDASVKRLYMCWSQNSNLCTYDKNDKLQIIPPHVVDMSS